jgi:hypothetical protein
MGSQLKLYVKNSGFLVIDESGLSKWYSFKWQVGELTSHHRIHLLKFEIRWSATLSAKQLKNGQVSNKILIGFLLAIADKVFDAFGWNIRHLEWKISAFGKYLTTSEVAKTCL